MVSKTLLSQRVRLCNLHKVGLAYDIFDKFARVFLKFIAMDMIASETVIFWRMLIVDCGIRTDNHGDSKGDMLRRLNVVSTSLPKVA